MQRVFKIKVGKYPRQNDFHIKNHQKLIALKPFQKLKILGFRL